MLACRPFLIRASQLCFALLVGGCASIMQPTGLTTQPSQAKALVTFVRPSIFFGDGVDAYVWDRDHFIGAVGAGTLVQYETEPGEHLFLGSSENWTYAKANLEPGKHYFIKTNIFPGAFYGRVAFATVPPTDPRLVQWLKLKPMKSSDKQQDYVTKNRAKAHAAAEYFDSGGVSVFATLGPSDGR